MRAHFIGDYKIRKDVFYRFDFVSDRVLTRIYDLLKEDLWKAFLNWFSDLIYDEAIPHSDTKIIRGGVRGLYTIMESILIVDKNEKICGAFIHDGKVHYFTSEDEYKHQLPGRIEEWRENFKEVELVWV